jgi:hypothetical protein
LLTKFLTYQKKINKITIFDTASEGSVTKQQPKALIDQHNVPEHSLSSFTLYVIEKMLRDILKQVDKYA